jgi:ParB family chromosome partitioning protein
LDEPEHIQEQVAKSSTVANYIRLLKLPPDIQVAVRNSAITIGHVWALINVDRVDKQLYVFH